MKIQKILPSDQISHVLEGRLIINVRYERCHGNHYFDLGLRDAVSILTFFGIVAFFIGATFSPLFYYCGTEKADVLLIISLIISVGFAVLMVWLLNYLNDFQQVSNSQYGIVLMVMWLTALIVFLVSRFSTNYIYQKVEY